MSDEKNVINMEDKSNVTETGRDEATSNEVASTSTTENVTEKITNLPSENLTSAELATLDYADFSTPARMLALGEVLAKSQLVPLKKPQDVMTALMTGKELGLPFITSVSQIYPINGRPTLGVHIQRGILIQNGVISKKTEDAVSIYNYFATEEDGVTPARDSENNLIFVKQGTLEEQPEKTRRKEYTKRTSYYFKRKIRMADNSYETMEVTSSFTLIDAMEAELTNKDVWKKYWRRMLDARAFTIGAREIADDLLLGMMSPSELSSNFYINDKGEEVHNAEIVDN